MEVFRRLGIGQQRESVTLPSPRTVQECFKNGRRFSHKWGIDIYLPLAGNDRTLLYVCLGLKRLYEQIEESQETLHGRARQTREIVKVTQDTPRTRRLKDNAENVQDAIEGFIAHNYQGTDACHRARNIHLAVSILFAQTHYVNPDGKTNKKLTETTITQWAQEWRPRISQA